MSTLRPDYVHEASVDQLAAMRREFRRKQAPIAYHLGSQLCTLAQTDNDMWWGLDLIERAEESGQELRQLQRQLVERRLAELRVPGIVWAEVR